MSFSKAKCTYRPIGIPTSVCIYFPGVSSGLSGAQKTLDKVALPDQVQLSSQKTKVPDIDPNKFIPVKTQKLRTALQEFEEGGDTESEEEEEQQRMNLMEAFADDDIADEFM